MADRTKVQAAVRDLQTALAERLNAQRNLWEANDRSMNAQRAVDTAILTLAKLAEDAPTLKPEDL